VIGSQQHQDIMWFRGVIKERFQGDKIIMWIHIPPLWRLVNNAENDKSFFYHKKVRKMNILALTILIIIIGDFIQSQLELKRWLSEEC